MTVTTFDTNVAGAGTYRVKHGLMHHIAAWWNERREYNRVMHELRMLDDRTLDDIGITRADFSAVAAGTYQR